MAMSADTAFPTSLTGLPDELILMICSLLPVGDILSVKNSCHRLRDIASDPSLWHAVALSYRGRRDDPRLRSALKLTVPHARKFALTVVSNYKCATSKFLPLLKRSLSLTSVSLHGYQITQIQLNAIISALPHLMDFEVQLIFKSESDVIAALESTCCLQSLVITCRMEDASVNPARILRVWSSRAGYKPPELGLQLLPTNDYFSSWKLIDCVPQDLPSTKHEARLLLYDAPSAFSRISDLLTLQVEFRPSQSPFIACLQLSSTELSEDTRVYLSGNGPGSCNYNTGNTTVHRVRISPTLTTCIPSSLTHLLLDDSKSLTSANLEVLANNSPKLIRLSLCGCVFVLKELQGLGAIVTRCPQLEDLRLCNIHSSSVKCVDSLWEILSQMRLIRLVVDACMLGSRATQESHRSASDISLPLSHTTTQAKHSLGIMTSLAALEVPPVSFSNYCRECRKSDVVSEVVMSFMPTSLEFIRLSTIGCSLLRGLLKRVQHLKYLHLRVATVLLLPSSIMFFPCLEQVYIECKKCTLTENNITALTSGGKITHAFLSLLTIDKENILNFMQNSPRLIMFCVRTVDIDMTEQYVKELRMVAKLRGVLTFKTWRFFRYKGAWRSHVYKLLHLTKLLPIFSL